jgi:hypothetical protein
LEKSPPAKIAQEDSKRNQQVARAHPSHVLPPELSTGGNNQARERLYHVENSPGPEPTSLPEHALARHEAPAEVPALPAEPLPPPVPSAKPDDPLVSALRCLLNKQPAEAVELLKSYDKPTQELLLCLLPLVAQLTEGGLNQASPQFLSNWLDQLNSLAIPLRARAPLAIDKMCFCSRIRHFGDYDPLPEDYCFEAGNDNRPGERIQLYVEVRNFTSEVQGDFYITRLASSLWICDFNKKLVFRQDFPDCRTPEGDTADRSRTPRTDYFITYKLQLPAKVPPGKYTLWVQVEDVLSRPRRLGQRSLDFVVTPEGTAHSLRDGRPLDEGRGNK